MGVSNDEHTASSCWKDAYRSSSSPMPSNYEEIEGSLQVAVALLVATERGKFGLRLASRVNENTAEPELYDVDTGERQRGVRAWTVIKGHAQLVGPTKYKCIYCADFKKYTTCVHVMVLESEEPPALYPLADSCKLWRDDGHQREAHCGVRQARATASHSRFILDRRRHAP